MDNRKPKSINVSPEVHTELLSLKVDLCRTGKSEMCNSMDSLINYLITKERHNPIEDKLAVLDQILTENYTFPRSAEETLEDLRTFFRASNNNYITLNYDCPNFGEKGEKKSFREFLLYKANLL